LTLRLYMDVHVDIAITRGLRNRGVDVVTAQEDGAAEMPDTALLDRCLMLGRVIVSYDQDFLAEAHRRQAEGGSFAGVWHAQRATLVIGQMIDDLELMATVLDAAEAANRVTYLPLQ
jgi:Domain of unknown function (DUF5615)